MTAYYNENDPKAAAWLRELIANKLIAQGDVDERDIRDIRPGDLAGFHQCHFFAGIGGWSYALRLAGWPDDKPVWTGSCPCQPFSAAGKGAGFDDERHLWPAWFWLIEQCRPDIMFGEQVASKAALVWFDLVSADLEATGYAVGAVDFPACGVGAPHIRNRLWWVADSDGGHASAERQQRSGPHGQLAQDGSLGGLANGKSNRREQERQVVGRRNERAEAQREPRRFAERGETGGLDDHRSARTRLNTKSVQARESESCGAGAVSGFWHPADWLPCTDGKARPVEPGTSPLAYGLPARVGRLRGYGNAIVSQAAAEFIKAYLG